MNKQLNSMPINTHFWGLYNDQMAIFIKNECGYEVCGGWEGTFEEELITFVSIIENPLPDVKLYYGNYD